MKVKVTGLTESVITLNLLGVVLQGEVEGLFDISSQEQMMELEALKRSGLISLESLEETETEKELGKETEDKTEETTDKTTTEKPKRKRGRPKGSKNKKKSEDKEDKPKRKRGRPKGSKNKPKTEQEKASAAEAETQKMGSKVVVSTGKGEAKVAMKHSFAGEIAESSATEESLKAMEKIQEEEAAEKEGREPDAPDTSIDESQLDPSEQMGRKAVVSRTGDPQAEDMKNSVLPGAEDIKNRDPFIDREENAANEKARKEADKKKGPKPISRVETDDNPLIEESFEGDSDAFIDQDEGDDLSDAFIEM
jgi:hypothetical protein